MSESSVNLEAEGSRREEKLASFRGRRAIWKPYLAAACCILVAFGIRFGLSPVLGEELPLMLFIAAAMVAAWYAGAVAGIVSLLLGLFLADIFFLPGGRFALSPRELLLHLVRYLFTASLGIVLIEVMHRGRRRTQSALEQLRCEVRRRQRSEAALVQAQAQLRHHARQLEAAIAGRTLELTRTLEALQSLLYQIAHNLRAPLRAMKGYATLLEEEYGLRLDATGHCHTRSIAAAADRMDALITGLLEYGRLGYEPLKCGPVEVAGVLRRVEANLASEIGARQAKVRVLPPLPVVWANAAVLEQMLTNLVENALRFAAPDTAPCVEIRAELMNRAVRLWVQDNGLGIAPCYHERIFGLFETLGRGGNEGIGMGLAIVREGAQRLGGQAGVESRPGGGSRFWLELPVPSPEQPALAA